jgi:hypothetical protein
LAVLVNNPDGLQQLLPTIGGVHIARLQGTPLQITELVEHEQRLVTGAAD